MTSLSWCPHCSTLHDDEARCPGELRATGPEHRGTKLSVDTPHGPQVIGVLVAPSHDLWRARILTYPNVLWSVPGGRASMKFTGRTAREAEQAAITFIRRHCTANGFRRVESDGNGGRLQSSPGLERKPIRVPLRFGARKPDVVGMTVNLSDDGMFIGTPLPMEAGEPIRIHLQVLDCPLVLRGVVMWNRAQPGPGRPAGMGVRLLSPPPIYPNYVRRL